MAVIQDPITLVKQKVTTGGAARVSAYPRQGEHYRLCQFGAIYTGFAAGTATAGHVYAFRWGSATHACVLQAIRVKRQVIVGFTAAQEFATALYRLTGYTASHTGGTEATKTGDNFKKDTASASTRLTSSMIVSGGALTAGTHTLDAQPFAADSIAELAAAVTVAKGAAINLIEWDGTQEGPMILRQDQGFLVRNEVLMGAAGTIRPIIQVDWAEVLLADL